LTCLARGPARLLGWRFFRTSLHSRRLAEAGWL
jgi:hypothetical protein